MNLADVIAEIREKYPNGYDDPSLIRKADLIQKRIYRLLKKENWLSFDLIAEQAEYPLPVDQHNVFQVTVMSAGVSQKYPLRQMIDFTQTDSKYFYFVSTPEVGDWIGLYPVPTANETQITIYFYEVPGNLTDTSSVITLYENYRMMLVYGVCKELAENSREMDMANGFAQQYNTLESELMGLGKKTDVKTVRNTMGW